MWTNSARRLRRLTPPTVRRLAPTAIKKRIPAVNAPSLPPDLPPEFGPLYERCRGFTLTSVERAFSLYEAARYISQERIRGDFVECGVWRGGSSMLAGLTLKAAGDVDRHLYLYDTYAGMSRPGAADGGSTLAMWERQDNGDHNGWCYAPLEEVRATMHESGFPPEQVHFVVGKVEDTIPATLPDRIALLRLDTDFYESTFHELRHLYPKLVTGGILIIDDYGYWEGARRAVDEYFAELAWPPFLIRVDETGRVGIKPPPRK